MDAEERIAHLNFQVVGLYNQGKYKSALELVPQACALAIHTLGASHSLTPSSVNNATAICWHVSVCI